MKKNFSKLLALYLPYLLLGLAATNFGEAWRLAEGKEMGDRILSLMSTIPAAFANPLPSLHPLDILVGICCGAGLRLAVYLKSKNAKKYRHGMEYGSARCDAAGGGKFQRHHLRQHPCQRGGAFNAGSQHDADGSRPAVRAVPAIVLHRHYHENLVHRHFCHCLRQNDRDLLHGEPCPHSDGNLGQP